jgi:hypothetical protein
MENKRLGKSDHELVECIAGIKFNPELGNPSLPG